MKGSSKKFFSGATAIVCALALLLTGTFAWQAVTTAVNEFSNKKTEVVEAPGANLHDDFDATTGDKDVYVENTGETPVYVRVMLQELLDKTTHEAPASPVWETHIPDATVEDCDNGYHDAFTDAFEWTMGNDDKRDYNSIVGTTEWTAAADREELDELVGDAFGDATTAKKTDTSAGTIKELPACEVISMADYNARTDKDTFAGWVYDTDGYAYWSQPLAAGEATGLLLDKVSLPGDETYYYAINVIMEYVDEVDLPAWLDGTTAITEGSNAGQTTTEATADAEKLLKNAAGIVSNPFEGATVGAVIPASGWDWVVIKVDGDNALVTTTELLGTIRFNPSTSAGKDYNGSTLDGALRTFYNGLVSYDEISEDAKITVFAQPSDFATAISPWNDLRPVMAAGLSKVDPTGDKTCFALSYDEACTYLEGHPNLLLAKVPAAGKTKSPFGNGFTTAWTNNGNQRYWLRSPGNNASSAWSVNETGGIFYNNTVNVSNTGARPALWVSIK